MAQDNQDSKNNKALSQEDALKAMAAGQELWDEPAAGGAAHDESHTENVQRETNLADHAASVSVSPNPAVAAGSDTAAARRKAATAHNYKKLMIPLLIVVGGLLLLMGGAVVFLDATGTFKGASESSPLGGPMGAVLVYSAFPLGIILLVGAWLFHKEVKQLDRRP